jgi:EpsI family protein
MDDAIHSFPNGVRFGRFLYSHRVAWAGIILLFALFYGHVIPGLVGDWYENQTFSYGFLVPLIAAYLIWQDRDRLKSIAPNPSLWGAIPLSIGVLLGLMGQAIGDEFSMRLSMVLTLASSVYMFLGGEFFRALGFPLLYLLLMIPAPYVLIKDLTIHLRYLDASHAANILQLLGIPVFVEAYFIYIPNMTLEVADVCSGVSSVFALFALGAVYAHFLPIRRSLKVLLVICTFPFAMIANLIRIVVISVLAYKIGPIVFQSTFHWLTGTTIFVLALVMLISTGEVLRRNFPWVPEPKAEPNQDPGVGGAYHCSHGLTWMPFFLFVVVVGVGLMGGSSLGNIRAVRLSGVLGSLANLGGYTFSESRSSDFYKDPLADAVLSVFASAGDDDKTEIFIGYRGEQTGGQRLRSPKLVFPDNWNSVWLKPAAIEIAGGPSIHGNWMLTRKGDAIRLVLYWYQFGNSAFGGEFEYRLHQLKRALLERRSDGAVVRLATPVPPGQSIDTAQERLRALGVSIYPKLVKLLTQ